MSDEQRDDGKKGATFDFSGRCRDAKGNIAKNSMIAIGLRPAEKLARSAAKAVPA